MFIQVIQGTVTDAEAMERLDDRWQAELRPGAAGFLGATIGIADDDRFVALARFESPEAARSNSERAEQGAWWAEMAEVTNDVIVHDCSRVETLFGGGKDDAGFVQVMEGRVKDRARADAVFARGDEAERVLGAERPDVVGEVVAFHDDDDGYTNAVYFSSEADARANEGNQLSPAAEAMMQELSSALEVTGYLDLRRLHLH